MEQKGEFEQRPEVKPADQVPFSRPKASPLPWILCAVFAVAAVGMGVFLVLGGTKKDEGKTNCVTTAENQEKETPQNENTEDADLKLRKIVKGLERDLIDYFGYAYNDNLHRLMYTVDEGFDSIGVNYEFEDGYVTGVDRSYEVIFTGTNSSEFYIQKKVQSTGFADAYAKIMAKYGLSKISDDALKTRFFANETAYVFGNNSGYICELIAGGDPVYLSCADTNTVSEEKKQLVKELIDAYKEKNEHAKNAERIYINADPEKITKGKTDEYDIITATESDAAAIFYRKDGGKWVYAFSAQGVMGCDDYEKLGLTDIFECKNY